MITGIFGKPRAGKTTYMARLVQLNKRKQKICQKIPLLKKILKPYDVVYCTDPTIQDTVPITYEDLGKFKPHRNSLYLFSEAGIGLNNRRWKTLTDDAKYFIALHGHLGADILWDSQSVDVDKVLLSRTHKLWLASKFLAWTMLVPIKFSVDVDKETKQLVDAYSKPTGLGFVFAFIFGMVKRFRRRPWYKYFDSFNDFKTYTEDDPAKVVERNVVQPDSLSADTEIVNAD